MPLEGEYAPSPSQWSRDQAEAYEASGGQEAATLADRPIVVVTSVGARSGMLRKTPLMRIEHDGRYAVVASYGGSPQNPSWYHNIATNPHVELQDGAVKCDMVAREVSGAEYDQWWERAVEAFPNYAEYQEKTSRRIPLVVLEPA